jgi:hypothetical protein
MEYEYGKIRVLNQNLEKHKVNETIVSEIMKNGELIKKTSKNSEKSIWLFNAMKEMDKLIDKELRQKIREDCACCLSGKRQAICKKIYRDYETNEKRIQAINETHLVFGNEIKKTGTKKYEVRFFDDNLSIQKCVCLKDLNEGMPISYCYCCGGHVRHHLENVLGVPLKVKVISSALSSKGTKNCVFELLEIS